MIMQKRCVCRRDSGVPAQLLKEKHVSDVLEAGTKEMKCLFCGREFSSFPKNGLFSCSACDNLICGPARSGSKYSTGKFSKALLQQFGSKYCFVVVSYS